MGSSDARGNGNDVPEVSGSEMAVSMSRISSKRPVRGHVKRT